MGFLLRLPEDLDARVRDAAATHGVTITDWLRSAAEEKLRDDQFDMDEFVEFMNRENRGVLDRLAD